MSVKKEDDPGNWVSVPIGRAIDPPTDWSFSFPFLLFTQSGRWAYIDGKGPKNEEIGWEETKKKSFVFIREKKRFASVAPTHTAQELYSSLFFFFSTVYFPLLLADGVYAVCVWWWCCMVSGEPCRSNSLALGGSMQLSPGQIKLVSSFPFSYIYRERDRDILVPTGII
jgi:hypothetical protein